MMRWDMVWKAHWKLHCATTQRIMRTHNKSTCNFEESQPGMSRSKLVRANVSMSVVPLACRMWKISIRKSQYYKEDEAPWGQLYGGSKVHGAVWKRVTRTDRRRIYFDRDKNLVVLFYKAWLLDGLGKDRENPIGRYIAPQRSAWCIRITKVYVVISKGHKQT